MKEKLTHIVQQLHPARLSALATYLLRDEAISGKLILVATLLALLAANTALGPLYASLLHVDFTIGLGTWTLSKDLQHWIDEGLMAIFFLVVGLELKRELVQGELRRLKTASLPFAAALGGMIVPAVLYLLLNFGGAAASGWAIPMATDIAFAIGILALVGKGIPSSIRLFLLTLAIVDDIGAVIVIAVFYSTGINLVMLLATVAIAGTVWLLGWRRWLNMPVFVIAAVGLWLTLNASGVHPSIAGALIGLLAPVVASAQRVSIAERLERVTIPISTLVVVPLFAFANTGIALSLDSFQADGAVPLAAGIVLGLVLGKVVGVVGASWLTIRLGLADLPSGATWRHIVGVGLLAGIGFTVAIFVTDLAFESQLYVTVAKLSIFAASVMSAAAGLLVLRRRA